MADKKANAKKLKTDAKKLQEDAKKKQSVTPAPTPKGQVMGITKQTEQIPMSEEELNEEMSKIFDSMNLGPEVKKAEMAKPMAYKWQIYKNFKKNENSDQSGSQDDSPQKLLDKFLSLRDTNVDQALPVLQKILVLLRTAPIRWVQHFIGIEGIAALSTTLSSTTMLGKTTSNTEMQIQQECVNCFRAILNTDVGVDAFKYEKDTVHSLVLILDAKNIITRTQTLMLLSIICTLDPSYFLLIIDAFHHFKLVKREKYRFERLISSISEIKDQEFRANVLCLINTLITHTPEDATRLSLIKDFKQLKLPEIIEEIRLTAEEELLVQIQIYDELLSDDEIEFTAADTTNPMECARVLKEHLNESDAISSFVSIMHHMVLFSGYGTQQEVNAEKKEKGWKSLEQVMRKAISATNGNVIEATVNEIFLENKIKDQMQQIMDLEDKLMKQKIQAEVDLDILQTEIKDLKKKLDESGMGKQEAEEIRSKLLQLEAEKEVIIKKLEQTTKDIGTFEQINANLEQVNKKLKEKVNKLNELTKEKEGQIALQTQKISDLELKLNAPPTMGAGTHSDESVEDWINRYKKMETALMDKVGAMTIELEGHKRQKATIMKEMEELKKKLSSTGNPDDLKKAKDQVEKLQKELDEINKKLKIALEEGKGSKSATAAPATPAPAAPAPPPAPAAPAPPPPPPPMGMGAPPPPPMGMGAPPPPPPPMGMGAPPPPPPPMGMGGPPPPPPPMGMGGPPPPPPPMGMGGPPPPPPMMGGPPPPPMMGGPPPPMMGGPMIGGMQLPKLPIQKPKGNTRQFHFEAIPKKDLKDTIFMKSKVVEQTNNLIKNINLEELETMFTTKTKEETSSGANAGEKKPEKTIVSLLDGKRSYNISLQLGSLRGMTYDMIRKAIIAMDETVVNDGNITTLRAIAPMQEEIDLVTNYTGEDELAEPDKFFKVMAGIPNIPERLDCWTFKLRFLSVISKVRPDVENLCAATKEIKESKKFLQFLGIVLTVGNFLNGKTPTKVSYGFKLKTLPKLADTKSGDGKTSLLQYIVTIIETKYPELKDFYTELEHVPMCTKILVNGMEEDMNDCKKNLALITKHIKLSRDAKIENDNFPNIMEEFAEKGRTALSLLDTKWQDMMKSLEEAAVLFNEEKKDLTKEPDKFFDVLTNFINLYKTAIDKVQKDREAKEKKEKQEAAKKKAEEDAVAKKKAAAMNAMKPAPKKEEGRGMADARSAALKDGSLLKKKRNKKGGNEDDLEEGGALDSNALNSAFAKIK